MEMFEIEDFIDPIELQCYNDFWFDFKLDDDWKLEQVKFQWKKLKPDLWEAIFLMRGEFIKAHRKERDQYRKKIQAVEKREEYKAELQRCMEKNKRQRKDNHYQERTCTLYRKILERLVDLPCESD